MRKTIPIVLLVFVALAVVATGRWSSAAHIGSEFRAIGGSASQEDAAPPQERPTVFYRVKEGGTLRLRNLSTNEPLPQLEAATGRVPIETEAWESTADYFSIAIADLTVPAFPAIRKPAMAMSGEVEGPLRSVLVEVDERYTKIFGLYENMTRPLDNPWECRWCGGVLVCGVRPDCLD
jgi:hypothetical protein